MLVLDSFHTSVPTDKNLIYILYDSQREMFTTCPKKSYSRKFSFGLAIQPFITPYKQ
jgi:hypothetical protein